MPKSVPEGWFKYDYPLKETTETSANYDSCNTKRLSEMFANMLGENPKSVRLRYQNGKTNGYPSDCEPPERDSIDMKKYKNAAIKSQRLKLFMEESPAEIEYFKNSS